MEMNKIDIKENFIYKLDSELLSILLLDRTTGKNIIWATDNYSSRGIGYSFNDHLSIMSITGRNGNIIKPRIEKSKAEQATRIKEKAEVFTPSWICNKQNNLIDNAWFGRENVFNVESDKTWTSTTEKILFPEGKIWQDYVKTNRLEITCGEAPYLVSRYDMVTGAVIDIQDRIGLLDRKLRVVNENTTTEEEWLKWTTIAYQSIYGYEWQGDNILLARENLLLTFVDYYVNKFNVQPSKENLRTIANIISWNIWQMDGLKFVIPNSCHNSTVVEYTLFGEETHEEYCEGCRKNNHNKHNGIYCYIMDWETNKKVKFVSLIKK